MDTITPDRTFPKENMIEIEIPYELFQYLSKDQCNLDNVCRICLSINEEGLYPLFTHSGEGDSVSVNMIKTLSEVQISEHDGLPRNICGNCQKGLLFCYDFKNKCIKSDYTLKSVLKGEFVDKIKEPEAQNDSKIEEVLVEDIDIKPEIKDEEDEPPDIDYLEDQKDSVSDNELSCVGGERENSKRKTTISKKQDPENSQESVQQGEVKKKTNKKLKHSCSFCPKQTRLPQTTKEQEHREYKKNAEKNRREIIKANPEVHNAVKAKARDRYYRRKAKGDIIPTSEMDVEKREAKRLQGRLKTQRYRERQKQRALQEASIVSDEDSTNDDDPLSSPPREQIQPRKSQTTEVRRESKKNAEKRRRERLKANPELYNALKAKARERYYSRKARGEIIPASEMNIQERRAKQLRDRQKSQLYRYRQKQRALQEAKGNPSIDNAALSSPPRERIKFHKVKSLRAHTSEHHKESQSPFPCDKCKEGFDAEFDLVLHGMLHTPGPNWTCTECHKEFKVRTAFRRHIRRHMQCSRFACEVCGKMFVELCALRRHARVHITPEEEKKFACKICDKRYKSLWSVSAHEARHGQRRELACACGKSFTTPRLLASHARTHTDTKPHACQHCARRFRHESTRNIHLRTHTGERPYACSLCDKTFIQRSNMTAHMRTHTGERPYKCSYCDGRFSSGSTLKAHVRTHTGERPYSCKICGKSFARLNVKLHMRLHTGERPHACSLCPKRFINVARLRDHQRTHTGDKPFQCALCSTKFITKANLIKHFRTHHKNKHNGKGLVMYMPVTVTDKSLNDTEKQTQYVIVEEPNKIENLPTIHVAPDDMKTEVIVVDAEQNLITNGIAYVNDLNCASNMELVTVNEEEMSLTTGNALIEGTTVKVYQYDQSLLQIHSGGGHLTISRISSKMTANLM